jgi:hypothetical protein
MPLRAIAVAHAHASKLACDTGCRPMLLPINTCRPLLVARLAVHRAHLCNNSLLQFTTGVCSDSECNACKVLVPLIVDMMCSAHSSAVELHTT